MLNLYMSADGTSYELVATGESMLAEHGLIHACFTARAVGDVQLFMDGTPVATGTAPARFPSIPAPRREIVHGWPTAQPYSAPARGPGIARKPTAHMESGRAAAVPRL